MSTVTRPTAVAGRFYPADAKALARQVGEMLADAAAPDDALPPKVLVVPHAGYVYSGPVAAHAYARLMRWRSRVRRVVLLGPVHRVPVRGLAVPSASAFETPLGRVELDRAAIDGLADLPQVVVSDAAHAQEHALEVQLPFLQTVLERFTLVPLAVGSATAEAVAQVIERLWGGDETLVVISTDLSHYLPYRQAQAIDRATAERIVQLDPQLDHHEACGATPLAGALVAARAHGLVPHLLDLRNSGDTAGDRSRVVGYCAVALTAPAGGAGQRADEREQKHEDAALGGALLARARNAIADAFSLPPLHEPFHAALTAPGATFVTLRIQGELRGCVGTLTALRPLGDDVRLQALCAAFRDTRFEPLARPEFDELAIEVSLLEPALPIAARSEADAHAALRPGVDGVILEWRGARATFLPQVWEQLPDPREFLAALKRKAGLAPKFWADDLRLSRYRVRKFVETERIA
ncbi:MAG TPA: AmmeMemoRadiSam system protein B [Burkholderiaceae bacterium]|nr:AmmeMemoRadiSam system protein B [Burkholderiaceae bacterium]